MPLSEGARRECRWAQISAPSGLLLRRREVMPPSARSGPGSCGGSGRAAATAATRRGGLAVVVLLALAVVRARAFGGPLGGGCRPSLRLSRRASPGCPSGSKVEPTRSAPDPRERRRRRRVPPSVVSSEATSTARAAGWVLTAWVFGAVAMRPLVPAGMSRSAYRCGLDEYVSTGSGWPNSRARLMSAHLCRSSQSTNVTAMPVLPARPVRPARWR